jgi:hypothetical protein
MKFQVASDLHLECVAAEDDGARLVPDPAADALILAGDIAVGADAWATFATWPAPVLYVPGNHEFFGGEFAAVRGALRARADAETGAITLLDGEAVVQVGPDGRRVRVLGTTLWTDFRVGEPAQPQAAAMAEAQRRMRDYRNIRLGDRPLVPADLADEHARQRAWLARRLAEPFDGPTVVITHHGPSARSIHPRFATYPGNGAFVSALDPLLAGVALWVHGHTHSAIDYLVDGCRVVANPRGYRLASGGWENPSFDPLKTVAV